MLRFSIVNFVLFFLVVYLSYQLISGSRGVISYFELEKDLATQYELLENTKFKRLDLEHKVIGLKSESLNLDLLEERTKLLLGFVHKNESLIIAD